MTAGFVMVRRTLTLVFATFSLLAPEVGGVEGFESAAHLSEGGTRGSENH